MNWQIEVRPSAQEDLRLIFRYLVSAHQEKFGYDRASATELARQRVIAILDGLPRIATAPHRGGRHSFSGKEYRHLTIDRTVYWFSLEEDRQTVLVEGVFFGGQDHLGRMLSRLTAEGGA